MEGETMRLDHHAIEYLLAYHRRIGQFITNHLSEVTNEKGAVIGYELHLNMEETERLIQEIDKP
jgi:hypothetical protein